MPGALLQLSSFGSASTYLHADPQVTFWKQVWRRSTPFALESTEMPFSGGAPDFGRKVTAAVAKGADLAHRAWLEITLPDLADYYTAPVTATAGQPLISRLYVEGDEVRMRVRPPANPGSWAWAKVYVITRNGGGGYSKARLLQANQTTEPAFTFAMAAGGGDTDHVFPRAQLPQAVRDAIFTPGAALVELVVTCGGANAQAADSQDSQPRGVLNLRWTNAVGLAAMESAEWEIGGSRIDRIPNSEFMDAWSELTEPEERRAGFNDMVGKYDDYDIWDSAKSRRGARTYYVPLRFSFCATASSAVPVLALQFHEMRVNVAFREALDLVRSNQPVGQLLSASGAPIAMTDCRLYMDMVYLDAEERRRMISMDHEQLVTQVQFVGDVAVAPGDRDIIKKIPLDGLEHPVKELVFVYQDFERYQRDAVSGNDWHNFQLAADPEEDAFQSVRITLNGAERAAARHGTYYRQLQPYAHHTRVPRKHVLCYNFGLDPEALTPSGTCNFSRLQQASLNVQMSPRIGPNGGRVKVYAIGYNVIGYKQGLAGLRFTNGG